MTVSPTELRPRGAIELMDAALRLGGRSSGAWLLTLPGSVALCAGVALLLEHAEKGGSLQPAATLVGLAWCLRALCQGAACHHLQQQLVGAAPASLMDSIRAALRRAPSLLFTATVLASLRLLLAIGSLGVTFLISGSQLAAYASAMNREGPIERLGRETHRAVGASQPIATQVRFAFLLQSVLVINLHAAVQFALTLSRALFGLDVAILQRMTSLENPGWWALLIVVTFAVLEPARAAVAVLLLLDAQVRRGGMDLHARLEALASPTREVAGKRRPRGVSGAAALVALGLMLPLQARASLPTTPPYLTRLEAQIGECGGAGLSEAQRAALLGWSDDDAPTFSRWVGRLERETRAVGCEASMATLQRDLAGLSLASIAPATDTPARATVQAILTRSEFEQLERAEGSWVRSFWERLLALLTPVDGDDRPRREREPRAAPAGATMGDGLGLSKVLLIALPLLALVLAWLTLRRGRETPRADGASALPDGASGPRVEETDSALSHPPQTWIQRADGLAAQGRHREAIRSAYLATLAGLHHAGAIRYDPHRSNWDHLGDFRGPAPRRSAFRELTQRFDLAWYGIAPVGEAAWSRARALALPLVEDVPSGSPEEAPGA